jgi:hypothetical protein
MKKMTLKESIKFVKSRKNISNEALLEMYDHLCIINNTELWKNPTFYKNSDYDPDNYINGTWSAFLHDCYHLTVTWFNKMSVYFRVFGKREARRLLVLIGRESCSTLISLSKQERIDILAYAEKDGYRKRMLDYKYELFGKPVNKNIQVLRDKHVIKLEKEIEKRDKTIEKRDKKIESLLKEISNLKIKHAQELKQVRDVFTILDKAIGE